MEVQIIAATGADRPVVQRLLELYQHDFSEFDGRDVNSQGEYGYQYLDRYWTDHDRHAFLFKVDGAWAGFALIRAGDQNDVAEFFVMRKYRLRSVGRRVAGDLLCRFDGRWTVRQMLSNPSATNFWRSAIPVPFEERRTSDEVIQEFVITR